MSEQFLYRKQSTLLRGRGSPRHSVATSLLAKTTICVRPIVRLCLPAQTGEPQRGNPRRPFFFWMVTSPHPMF